MSHDPAQSRRSIRMQAYDYSQPGAYFVTMCTQNRVRLFGDIADGEMDLTAAEQMVENVWEELSAVYTGVEIDAFAVMPNHVHGIIVLGEATADIAPRVESVGAAPRGRPGFGTGTGQTQGSAPTDPVGKLSLADVVARFKTMTTRRSAQGVRHAGWPPFPGRLWQRNYFEHVIRDEPDLDRIRRYISAAGRGDPGCRAGRRPRG